MESPSKISNKLGVAVMKVCWNCIVTDGWFYPVDLVDREVAQKINWSDQTFNSWQQHLTFGNSIEPHQCLSDNPRYVRELTLIFLPLILGMRFTQILSIRTGVSIRTEEKSILRVDVSFSMLFAFL